MSRTTWWYNRLYNNEGCATVYPSTESNSYKYTFIYSKYTYGTYFLFFPDSFLQKFIINIFCVQNVASQWLIVVSCQLCNFSAIPWQEQVNFQWDDDEVRLVLDQQA